MFHWTIPCSLHFKKKALDAQLTKILIDLALDCYFSQMFLAIELSKFAYLTDKMLAVFIKSFQNHYNLNALSSIDWLSNALGIFFFWETSF